MQKHRSTLYDAAVAFLLANMPEPEFIKGGAKFLAVADEVIEAIEADVLRERHPAHD